ncbi:right-handed parallel beta-helix repeat-containing protein [Larkinella terrae]|uniref:PKD domain-containing protein n=1 Tax=Larkinella terrae TaxID=2025311 RepID=A0A7K0EN66_9BACT|nr:right-handed parallel beta-helix repeat-containing protein [Larkinella terrae]MRS63290.1 PKD domain-containing protein [Larkinella terrae]
MKKRIPSAIQLAKNPAWVNTVFTKRAFAILLSATFLVTGCKKDEVEPTNPTNTLTANAGADQEVQVGETVKLDGSASVDTKGAPLTYQWTIATKPAKSTAAVTSATTAKPTFVPDEVGDYELELTVSNANGSSKDKVKIAASVAQPVVLDKNITVKTVLTDRISNPDYADYIVPKSLAVTSELTINPGVVIAFERDTRFDINDGGGLIIAKGTADKKIRFIGVEKTKGYWVGIMIYSGSNANVLENIEVMHAGSRTIISSTKAGMALFGGGKAQIALKNSLFSQNDGYGLLVQEGSLLREFAANTFTKNTEAGIVVDPANVDKLDAASVFTGENGRNVVEIKGYYLREGSDITWGGFKDKTPYRLTGDFAVECGLTLSPGVTIEGARDVVMMINSKGYLIAKGTATDKVTFTGADRTGATWKGLMIYSVNSRNVIENAEISNGGSLAIVSGKKANLALYGGNLSIKNTTISNSGGYGIFVSYSSKLNADASTTNTFKSNAQDNVLLEK